MRGRGVNVNDTSAAWLERPQPLLELGFGLADEGVLDVGLAELVAVLGNRATAGDRAHRPASSGRARRG